MPFVQRVVSPIYISRSTKSSSTSTQSSKSPKSNHVNNINNNNIENGDCTGGGEGFSGGNCLNVNSVSGVGEFSGSVCLSNNVNNKIQPISDNELESVTNLTLSNALKQLASLVSIANEIFTELQKELTNVSNRSSGIKTRIGILQKKVDDFDPKLVAVRKYIN